MSAPGQTGKAATQIVSVPIRYSTAQSHWFPRHRILAQGRDGLGDLAYERHQPEQILRYHLVEAHYRFPLTLRYLFAAHPQTMGKVLGIGFRAISTHLI